MQLDCENARIDEISGNEKTLIQKIRVKYPSDRYYLSRIDSALYNVTYKSNTHLSGFLKGEELILPMIFRKNYGKVIDENKKRYLIVNQYSKAGLYDLQNLTWKIPLIYETMSKLDGGALLIHVNRCAGLCDMDGKVILPCMYRRIEFNKHLGVFIVEDENSKIGIYDPKTSSWNIPCKYSSISNFSSKIITVEKNDSIFLFSADKKLKYYENIEIDIENNIVLVKVGNEFRILNENSQEIFKKRFSELNYIGGYNDIIVKLKNNKYSLANIKHKTLMQDNYDNIEKLNNSFLVQKGNLYGIVKFVDGQYKEILPCVNDNILVEFNFFITENNNKYRLLNKEGKKVIDSDYDDIRICSYKNKSFKGVGEFANLSNDAYTQLAIVGTKDRYNVYDIKGTKMIEKDYQAILPLISSELASKKALHQLCLGFITKEKGSFGIIDLSGNTILSSEYSEIRHLNKGLMQIGKNNKYAVFDYFNKKFLTEFKYEQLMSYEESCIGIIDNEYYEISVYQNFKQEKLLTQSIEKKLNFHVLTKNISDKNTNNFFGSEVEPTKLDHECMSRIMGHYNNPKNKYTLVRNGLYYAESSDKKGAYFDTIGMLTPFASDHNIDIRLSQKLKNDLFPIELLSRYGLFDLKKRKFKILPKYENFKIIEDGRFFVVSIDNHYKIIDENDETIIDLGYLHAKPVYSNNSLIMKNMLGQYGIINLKNRQVKVNFEYDYIEPYANHRIAFAKKNNKYKLISYDNELLSDIVVDKVENLYIENLVLIQLGKNYSILDTKEMKVIPLVFSANSFHTQADVLNIFLKSDINTPITFKIH
jgi:hypothetical protein